MRVEDFMTRGVITITPDTTLLAAAKLMLQHRVYSGILVKESDTAQVLQYLADLWGYEVTLAEVSAQSDAILKRHNAAPAS